MSNFFKNINEMDQPYLIAEIGINHNGDLETAMKMAAAAETISGGGAGENIFANWVIGRVLTTIEEGNV